MARYRSAGANEESIITQELLPGTGDCIRESETVQLKLSAQPFQVDTLQVLLDYFFFTDASMAGT